MVITWKQFSEDGIKVGIRENGEEYDLSSEFSSMLELIKSGKRDSLAPKNYPKLKPGYTLVAPIYGNGFCIIFVDRKHSQLVPDIES